MATDALKNKKIGEIVADDYRAAKIFKDAGIDFCCGGNKSVEVACNEKNIDQQKLLSEIELLALSSPDSHHDFKNWDISFLADFIVNTHHKYVMKSLPDLVFYTQKIADVHGNNHPELKEVASLFSEINRELLQHLKQEEEVLFPAIKEVIKNKLNSYMQKSIKQNLPETDNDGEQVGQAVGMMLGGALADRIIDNLVSTDNYVLFSTTKISWEGETRIIGVGVFGNVFITKRLDEAMNEGLLKN